MGRGEAAPRGGQPGNLYVVLRVEDDERFERDGADLHTEVEVSFPQLALGDRIAVPTLEGDAEVEIAPGTQPGETLPLTGKGMPRLGARGKGDVVAHLKLVVPTALSAEEEAAPARLRGRRRPARQPREGRLLPAQEEEVDLKPLGGCAASARARSVFPPRPACLVSARARSGTGGTGLGPYSHE